MPEFTDRISYLKEVTAALYHGDPIPHSDWKDGYHLVMRDIFVQPKQRPRATRGGSRHYTPKETRVFEDSVSKAAVAVAEGRPPLRTAVIVHLKIWDKIDPKKPDWEQELYRRNLVYRSTDGDVDNKTKAILDACNGILYTDDCQINQLFVARSYSERPGFELDLSPVGISKGDIAHIGNFLRRLANGSA